MRLAVLITIIAIAVLMVAAAVGPFFVPTKTYQRFVEEALAERLDARVVIEGFKLRLIPYPGYTIEDLSLVSRELPFRGMPVIEAKKVIGSLSFGALFGGDIVTEVEARDVNINIRSQGGVTNIGMMLGLGATPLPGAEPPAKPSPVPEAPSAPMQDVPDAPIDSIPAMPAPSIEVKPDESAQGGRGLLIRSAFADDGVQPGRAITLERLKIIRGRIELTGEKSPRPLVLEGVSVSASNISLRGGFSASIKMSGTMAGQGDTDVVVEGGLIADEARRELTLRDARIYFGGTKLVADALIGYGMTPAYIDAHVATPNLSQAALAPMLVQMGWEMPPSISWQGALGADLSFKGSREAGQLRVQLDASRARVILGKGFSKEPGLPFKIQTEVIVKPSRLTVASGELSLEGSVLSLAGELIRDGAATTRLTVAGGELKLSAMRSLMPWLPDLDSVEGGRADISIEGSLSDVHGLDVEGRIGASKVRLAGIDLEEVEGSFLGEGEDVEFAALRAKFAGGGLSGNGRVGTGPKSTVEFDVVVNDADAKQIEILKGSVDGKASIVAKAKSEGEDRFRLLKNFTVAGSIVSDKAKVRGLEAAADAFSKGTWEKLAESTGAELNDVAEAELEKSSDEISDLRASFESSEKGVKLEGLSWKTEIYSAALTAAIDEQGDIDAAGEISVDGALSARLVSDPEVRKKVFDSKGRLIIPVKGSGKLTDPKLSLDGEGLTALMEDRLKPRPMVEIVERQKLEAEAGEEEGGIKVLKAPAIEMEVEEKAAPTTLVEKPEVKEEKAQAPAKKAARPKAPRKAPSRKRAPSQPDQSVDDILKVIIGD